MFYSLLYSTLLISLDPDKERQLYSKSSTAIHPWHYVNKIRMKYPYIISWDKLIRRLPGTRLQVSRMIEYIMGMPENNLKYPISYYHKLDLRLKPLICKLSYKVYGKCLSRYNIIYYEPYLVAAYMPAFIKCRLSCSEAREIVYWHRFHLPEYKITQDNYHTVIDILKYYPKLAQLSWMVDIQKYIVLDLDGEYCDIILNLCANPKIDKDIFKRFTEILECGYGNYMNSDLFHKYIQNMFRFRMKTGLCSCLNLELHYPQSWIQEDTLEWRIELYKLNTGLINPVRSYDHYSLICSIPGRHTEYLQYHCDNGFENELPLHPNFDEILRLLLA